MNSKSTHKLANTIYMILTAILPRLSGRDELAKDQQINRQMSSKAPSLRWGKSLRPASRLAVVASLVCLFAFVLAFRFDVGGMAAGTKYLLMGGDSQAGVVSKVLKWAMPGWFSASAPTAVPTGPGGVGSGLEVWVRADSGVTGNTDGASVTSWADQSPNAYNFSQGTGIFQPKYYSTTTSKLVNFNPVIDFDGVNDDLRNTTTLMPTTSAYTFLAVGLDEDTNSVLYRKIFGSEAIVDYFGLYKQGGPTNDNGWVPYAIGGQARSAPFIGDRGSMGKGTKFSAPGGANGYWNGTNFSSDSRTNHTQPQIVGFNSLNSATTDPFYAWTDGYKEDPNWSPIVDGLVFRNQFFTQTYIGSDNGVENWKGRIPEFLVFNRVLTDPEMQQVNSYLAIKYGVTLGQGNGAVNNNALNYDYLASNGTKIWDATANSGYKYDIAGIGRDDASGLEQKQSASVNTGNILTIGNGTIAASNAANPNTFSADLSFLVWGHDNANLGTKNVVDKPVAYQARLNRVWRADLTNAVSNLTVSFNLAPYIYDSGNAADYALLIHSANTGFATPVTTHITGAAISNGKITFTGANFNDGDYFTLAVPLPPPSALTGPLAWLHGYEGEASGAIEAMPPGVSPGTWNPASIQNTTSVNAVGGINFTGGRDLDRSTFLEEVTGDGILDWIRAKDSFSDIIVMPGLGNGTFDKVNIKTTTMANSLGAITLGKAGNSGVDETFVVDVNGDGIKDWLHAYEAESGGAIEMFPGNGDGTWNTAPASIKNTTNVNAVAGIGFTGGRDAARSTFLTDVTGDGKPDWIISREAVTDIVVLPGNGDGTFDTANPILTPMANSLGAVTLGKTGETGAEITFVVDVNGDGLKDWLHAYEGESGGAIEMFPGNGDGTWNTAPAVIKNTINVNAVGGMGFTGGSDLARSTFLADVTGDGKPDWVLSSDAVQKITVIPGVGDGTFNTASPIVNSISNSAGAVTLGQAGFSGVDATFLGQASSIFIPPPTLTKAFSPTTINAGGTSTLTFTITNGAGNPAQSGINFTDTLPTNVVVATPNGVSNTCGGTVTATAGSGSLSLSGGTMSSGTATCTIAVNVTSGTAGSYVNGAGNISGLAKLINGVTNQTLTVLGDLDGDGIADINDLDDDGDGIPDTVEGNGSVDTDGDGIPDSRDLDSDNDGINDVIEAGGLTDANGDGRADGAIGGNGMIANPANSPRDSDNDGTPDYRDLDSDNDGVNDVIESGNGALDANNDGQVDGLDTDGDGIRNGVDGFAGFGDAGSPTLPNTDGDGLPNYIDPDDDNDGVLTATEGPTADNDSDGVPNYLEPGDQDLDGDGISNQNDPDDDGDGIGTSGEQPNGGLNPVDTDGDGIPNYLDPIGGAGGGDSDGDGILDSVECPAGSACPDTDGDGHPNYMDTDDDGDGIPTATEGAVTDTDGDGVPDYLEPNNQDLDGDGLPNSNDPNDDGDGTNTSGESPGGGLSPADSDGDGIPNYLDPVTGAPGTGGGDSDGDGVSDAAECPGGSGCPDTDGDGHPNYMDTDDDNDGIPTATEGPTADTDGDGVPNYLEPNNQDLDGDGTPNQNDPNDDGDGTNTSGESPGGGLSPRDTDFDGIPDYLDPVTGAPGTGGGDSDGDGVSDAAECPGGSGCPDTDGDGRPNYMDTDDDGDGTPTATEGPTVDTDGDGVPNYLEPNNIDSDRDGLPNHRDPNDDGDGINTSGENPGGGLRPADSDGDNIPDYLDANNTNQIFKVGLTDPLTCVGPGHQLNGFAEIFNPNVGAMSVTATIVSSPGLLTVTNGCSANVGTCSKTSSTTYTWSGTLLGGQTVRIDYLEQVAENVTPGSQLCVTTTASFAMGQPLTVQACTTINCPTVGPGGNFPASSEASGQAAGSVLIYNIYTSNTDPTRQNTRINITNIHPTLSANVHLFFVSEGCSIADSYVCLTGNQTTSFLASDLDPGTTGYLVAVAVNSIGCPTNFNYLIGDEYVKFASGHAANLGAEAISALVGGLPACDGNSVIATLSFDGIAYDRVPRTLAASNIGSRADGNDTMLILNRIGGNLGTGAATLGSIFGIFYDDAEIGLSFSISGNCQLRSSINNSFPRTTPRFETFVPAGRTGWFKLYSQSDVGMTGAIINFNPNASASASAFNQGHNLHRLTLSATQSYVIPVFPPAC